MEPVKPAFGILAVGAAGPSAGLVIPELLKRGASVRGFVHTSEDELQPASSVLPTLLSAISLMLLRWSRP
jgi:hypothetical protein